MQSRPHRNKQMIYKPTVEFMRLAVSEAMAAQKAGDYAIGAVIVLDGAVIASSGNRIKLDCDPTQHAEMSALRQACKVLGSRHIPGAVLYTTAEPCPMCSAAAIWARLSGIVSGSTITDMTEFRARYGNSDWSWRTIDLAAQVVLDQGDPQLFLIEGFLREECQTLFHRA